MFTYYLVKGLEGAADTSHDGIVTADELAEYVHTQVRDTPGSARIPLPSAAVSIPPCC